MSKKRETPETEVNRLAERLFNVEGANITDRKSFNESYDTYMTANEDLTSKQELELRSRVFTRIRQQHPDIPFSRDDETRIEPKFKFNILGTEKGKPVFARRSFVVIKGVKHQKLRDSRGRFVGKQ